MSQVTGTETKIITTVEATYNVVPTLTAVINGIVSPYISESITKTQSLVESKAITNSRNPAKPGRGNYAVEGGIKTELNQAMYALLRYALGLASTVDSVPVSISANNATVGTPPYVHTFKVGTIPSFTLEKKFTSLATDKFYQYKGCKVSKLSFNMSSDGLVDMGVDIMGADTVIASNSMSLSAGNQDYYDLVYPHVPFQMFEVAAADLKVGGTAVAYISSLSFDLENNLDGSVYVIGGNGARQELPAGMVKVSGKLTALFGDTVGADSTALINDALAGTERSIDIIFTKGTGSGSVGNEKLRLVIPELLFGVATPLISGATGLIVELPFTGYYDNNSDSTSFMMVLNNNYAPRY